MPSPHLHALHELCALLLIGEYGYYCPVRLQRFGEFVDNKERAEKDLSCASEYRGRYYVCTGPEELHEFLKDPEQFTPPRAPRSLPVDPDLLPKRILKMQLTFPDQVQFLGYCAVTFIDGNCQCVYILYFS